MYKHLRALRESLGMTQAEFGQTVGIAKSTYNNYETGVRNPKSDFWVAVAKKHGVTIDYLMGFTDDPRKTVGSPTPAKNAPPISGEAIKIAKDYDVLDAHGRHMARIVIDSEIQRMQANQTNIAPEKPVTKIIPLFGNSFAAGTPEPDFGGSWEQYEVPTDSLADFAIHINGNSMDPYLPDGSIALGKREKPHDGDVGAFLLDGEFLCKQVAQDSLGNSYLFSLNRARADADITVWHDGGQNLIYFGMIIMDKRVPLPVV